MKPTKPGVARLFAIAGACLLPLTFVSFRPVWPPVQWRLPRIAAGDVGQIVPVSILFFLIAFVYFVFPKLVGRSMNSRLAQLHFWASLGFVGCWISPPLILNLPVFSRLGESKLGGAMSFWVWQGALLLLFQLIFVANILWSMFRGERILADDGATQSPIPTRQRIGDESVRRYGIALMVSCLLFGAANIVHFNRPAWCVDCFFPYGVPFTWFQDGGFAGGAGIVWLGLAADVVCVVGTALLAGGAWDLSTRFAMGHFQKRQGVG